jgi:hypothetical protein
MITYNELTEQLEKFYQKNTSASRKKGSQEPPNRSTASLILACKAEKIAPYLDKLANPVKCGNPLCGCR